MYFCLFLLALYPSIHALISLYIYILSIHIHIKEIYVKTFRSDLPTQKKPLLWQITLYQLLFAVICSFLVTLFDFCCYLFVLGNFVRFFYDYLFYWAFLLISHSAFSLCNIFQAKLKWIDTNDNDDKRNNNRHISIEIINSEKTEITWDEYRL